MRETTEVMVMGTGTGTTGTETTGTTTTLYFVLNSC